MNGEGRVGLKIPDPGRDMKTKDTALGQTRRFTFSLGMTGSNINPHKLEICSGRPTLINMAFCPTVAFF